MPGRNQPRSRRGRSAIARTAMNTNSTNGLGINNGGGMKKGGAHPSATGFMRSKPWQISVPARKQMFFNMNKMNEKLKENVFTIDEMPKAPPAIPASPFAPEPPAIPEPPAPPEPPAIPASPAPPAECNNMCNDGKGCSIMSGDAVTKYCCPMASWDTSGCTSSKDVCKINSVDPEPSCMTGRGFQDCSGGKPPVPPGELPEGLGLYYFIGNCPDNGVTNMPDCLLDPEVKIIYIAFANQFDPATMKEDSFDGNTKGDGAYYKVAVYLRDVKKFKGKIIYSLGGQTGSDGKGLTPADGNGKFLYDFFKGIQSKKYDPNILAKNIKEWNYVDGIDFDIETPTSEPYVPVTADDLAGISFVNDSFIPLAKAIRGVGKIVTTTTFGHFNTQPLSVLPALFSKHYGWEGAHAITSMYYPEKITSTLAQQATALTIEYQPSCVGWPPLPPGCTPGVSPVSVAGQLLYGDASGPALYDKSQVAIGLSGKGIDSNYTESMKAVKAAGYSRISVWAVVPTSPACGVSDSATSCPSESYPTSGSGLAPLGGSLPTDCSQCTFGTTPGCYIKDATHISTNYCCTSNDSSGCKDASTTSVCHDKTPPPNKGDETCFAGRTFSDCSGVTPTPPINNFKISGYICTTCPDTPDAEAMINLVAEQNYTIMNVAFIKWDTSGNVSQDFNCYKTVPPTCTGKPFTLTAEHVTKLKQNNSKVLISIGGGAAGEFNTNTYNAYRETFINNMVTSIIKLVDKYGFDGLDWDIENRTGDEEDYAEYVFNISHKLKQNNPNFLITLAPQTYFFTPCSCWGAGTADECSCTSTTLPQGAISPVFAHEEGGVSFVNDIMSWVSPQLYNAPGQQGVIYAKMYIKTLIAGNWKTGKYTIPPIPPEKLVPGFPAANTSCQNGCGPGYVKPTELVDMLNELKDEGINLGGLMSWDVGADSSADWSWVKGVSKYILPTLNPSLSHIKVSVVQDGYGMNKYSIDDIQQKTLALKVGGIYTFEHPSAHPLKFSTMLDGTHSYGSIYTENVNIDNTNTTIEITDTAPKILYYFCSLHPEMGGQISIN